MNSTINKLKKIGLFLLCSTLLLCVVIRFLYGGGDYYPDVSTPPILEDDQLEVVLEFDKPIGNVAVNKDGRIFFTLHTESRPKGVQLHEWINGQAVPFPDEESQESLFTAVLGIVIDQQNRLWSIDNGNHGVGDVRLLGFDLNNNELIHDHVFSSDVAPLGSLLQDLQIDRKGEKIYIADVNFARKKPAIVVYDINSKTAWRALEGHESVYPEDWIVQTPIKDMTFFGGLIAFKPGVDGIALGKNDEWLYYGAMTHHGLYRIRTSDINNRQLSAEQLSQRVEFVSEKPLNDGMSADEEGNVYITDVEHQGIMRVNAEGELKTLIRSNKIRWADGLSFGPDNWLYIADSALPHLVLQSKKHMEQQAPYYIFRFKPGATGLP